MSATIQEIKDDCRELAKTGKKFSLRQCVIFKFAFNRWDFDVCKQLIEGLRKK